MLISPASTVHGGQHDTEVVTFQWHLRAALVTDEIWSVVLEPVRTVFC